MFNIPNISSYFIFMEKLKLFLAIKINQEKCKHPNAIRYNGKYFWEVKCLDCKWTWNNLPDWLDNEKGMWQ